MLFGGLAERYGRLREAQDRLADLLPKPVHDVTHTFAELRNLPNLWPEYRNRRNPPWPEDPRLRFLWLINHQDAVLWMPTPADQDKRWLVYYGEQLRKSNAMHQSARAAPALAT